jgi:hypothetical protein
LGPGVFSLVSPHECELEEALVRPGGTVPSPMRGSRKICLVTALVAAAATAGCGGDDGDSGSEGSEPEPTADLAKPLLAECDVEGLQASEPERQIREGTPTGWKLNFRATSSKPNSGETTVIFLIEESPELPAEGVTGGQTITVDGQEASLRTITEPGVQHVAQWKTDKARYIAFGNGDTPARLKALIACMP